MAREMGFDFSDDKVLSYSDHEQYGLDARKSDCDYEFLFRVGGEASTYFVNADKTYIDTEILSSLQKCSMESNIEIRWEVSHCDSEKARNNDKAFSRFHPSFEKWGSQVKTRVMKQRLKWLKSCTLRLDRLSELNSSNCCLLRASIYMIARPNNHGNKALIPLMSVLKSRISSSPNGSAVPSCSILRNPLAQKLSDDCTTFEAICKTFRSTVDEKTFEKVDDMMNNVCQSSEMDSDIAANNSITLSGILSSTAFAVAGEYGKLAPQPERIRLSLRLYQRESLAWMIDQEEKRSISDPFWIKIQTVKPDESLTDLYFRPFNGCMSIDPPLPSVGGILAEEMGLGKTIIVASLICNTIGDAEQFSTQPASAVPITATSLPSPSLKFKIRSRGTLVVCPVSLLKQWEREFIKAVDPPLNVLCWYGGSRSTSPVFIADHDVVLTTYGIFGGGNYKPLLEIEWFRVVVDESTYLRGGGNSCTGSLSQIASPKRWAVSGTPFGDNFRNFRSTLRFLNVIPFYGGRPFEELLSVVKENPILLLESHAIPRLAYLLKCVLMRHVKDQELYGQPLVELPPATGHLVMIKQEAEERNVYDVLESHLVERADPFLKSRNGKLAPTSIVRMRTMLIPLRQMASGIRPTPRVGKDPDYNIPTLPEMSGYGAKIEQLLQDVRNEREMDPSAKIVVFTEFQNVKHKIQTALRENNYDVLTLDGDMTATRRGNVIKNFAEDNDAVVLVLSMSVGARGLTLTMANVVVLFELDWKTEEEAQAVNRIHRIGQTRSVKTLTYVTENSIDDRIMAIRAQQGKARFFADSEPIASKQKLSTPEVYRQLLKYEF